MTNSKKVLWLGLVASLVGGAGFLPGAYYWYRNNNLQSTTYTGQVLAQPAQTTSTPDNQIISGKPVRLLIPSLGMDLEVADGIYNPQTKEWTLSKDKAHFADLSVQPNNQQGNTFIYGHYRPEVFARLHNIQPGAEAKILTDNGHEFTYVFGTSKVTDPSDSSLLNYQGKPILTLQTCTGAWFQNRQLFTFDLADVK